MAKQDKTNIPLNEDYSLVPNSVAQDRRLSWRSRGIYCYLCSFGQDAVHTIHQIIRSSSRDGRISTRSGIKELLSHGYVTLKPVDNGQVASHHYKNYWHLSR